MIIETEEELLQALKQGLKKHAKTIVMTVLVFLSIWAGWYAAKRQNDNKLAQASVLYEELLHSLDKEDTLNIKNIAHRLITAYKHSPYAKLGALLLAKQWVKEGNFNLAKEQLMWVMEKSEITAIRQIARLRLASLWFAENQKNKALNLLSKIDDPVFFPLIYQMKGDIQLALGSKGAAKADYQEALYHWPESVPGKHTLQLKLKQLSSP